MASDQQFCLRWNNHQSTLVSVFDNLLESQTLVDCTLAADGQYLKAHKVVLSACSPYLEAILCQNLDKHPILILKDVKFSELKAMLDYMYRGEVNISQEQLSTFLKAAESLQIKGLTDSGGGGSSDRDPLKRQDLRKPLNQPVPHIPQPRPVVPHPGLMERRSLPHFPPHIADMQPQSPRHAREGSTSPTARKRRRPNRPSSDDSNFVSTPNSLSENQPDTSDSCDVPVKQASSTTPNVPNATTKAPETDSNRTTPQPQNNQQNSEQKQQVTVKKEFSEALLTPKTEFDYGNDNSMEDVTYEDDEEEEVDLSKPGTSFAANSQGFPPWQMGGDGSNDDSNNMYSPDVTAATNQNNSQDPKFMCLGCGVTFTAEYRLKIHFQFYCAFGPARSVENQKPDHRLTCFICQRVFKTVKPLRRHLIRYCNTLVRYQCQVCEFKSCWGFEYQKHMFRVHSDVMEELHMATMGMENHDNQLQTENEEHLLETGNEECQMELGNEEDRLVIGDEEDQLETEFEEHPLENGNEENQFETGNIENLLEPENVIDLTEIECPEAQLVSENTESLVNSETVEDQTENENTETLPETENFVGLTETEDSETQLQTENTGKLLEEENRVNLIETENTVKQLESETNENRLKEVCSENQSIRKPNMVNQHKHLSSKPNILPKFKFDFVRPSKCNKNVNKRKNNKNEHETAMGIKTGKENKGEKRKRKEKPHVEKKENDSRKKTKTENKKEVVNEQPCQRNNFRMEEGEENVGRERNEEEEAVVPVVNQSLDSWLAGLPTISEEEFERLRAADPIFQF